MPSFITSGTKVDPHRNIHVDDYGAKGDGVTNDGPALIAARDAAIAAKRPLQFGAKTYQTSSIIDALTGLTVYGHGKKTVLRSGTNLQAPMRINGALLDIRIEDMTFDANKANVTHNSTNGYAFYQWTGSGTVAEGITFKRIRLLNAAKYGATWSRVNDLDISDIYVDNAGTVAGDRSFSVFSASRLKIGRVRVVGGFSVGIAVHDSSDVRAYELRTDNAGDNGLQFFSITGGSLKDSRATGSTLNGCEVDGCSDFDVSTSEFSDSLFHGLHISRDTSPNIVRDVSVIGVRAHRNRFNGISVIGLLRGSIVGNNCRDNAQAADVAWQAGIQIQRNSVNVAVPSGLTVQGNVATDTRSTGKTQIYGIWFRDEVADTVATGNVCVGNATAGVQNSTSSTSLVLANNL